MLKNGEIEFKLADYKKIKADGQTMLDEAMESMQESVDGVKEEVKDNKEDTQTLLLGLMALQIQSDFLFTYFKPNRLWYHSKYW